MKLSIVIPVYLSRKNNEWKEGDAIYDHPTAINQPGTLVKTLESLRVIENEKFDVILAISTTTDLIDDKVEAWVRARIHEARYCPENLYIFTQKDLRKLAKILNNMRIDKYSLLSMRGYSQVRNSALISGIINKSDAIIFLDDDELVRDKKFIKKIRQGLDKKIGNKKVRFISGMCPEGETGSYIRKRKYSPWMKYWDKIKYQNETLVKAIEGKPRFKITPLTHGGLCVVHKEIFLKIPFDPRIQRGEDMDYNINCRMFGYVCYMDNQLEIRHCPPGRVHPAWQSFRADMTRFLIERNKIRMQDKKMGIKMAVKASDFDPYPGNFLKDNLEDMVYTSQITLESEYLSRGELSPAKKALENIDILAEFNVSKTDYFALYMEVVEKWKILTKKLTRFNYKLCKI